MQLQKYFIKKTVLTLFFISRCEVLQLTQNKGVAAIFDGIGNLTFLQGPAAKPLSCICFFWSLMHSISDCELSPSKLPGFSCLSSRGGMVLFGASSGFPRSVNLDEPPSVLDIRLY